MADNELFESSGEEEETEGQVQEQSSDDNAGSENEGSSGPGSVASEAGGSGDGSDHEGGSDKEEEKEESEREEVSDREEGSDNENEAKDSNAESEQEQSERSNAASENEDEEDQGREKGGASGSESDGERDQGEEEGEGVESGKESEQANSDKEQQSENEDEQEAHSDNENAEKNAIAEDLFGDADDISSGSEAGDKPEQPKVDQDEEEEEEEEEEEQQHEDEEQVEKPVNEEEEEDEVRRSDGEEEEDNVARGSSPADNDVEMPEEEQPPEETRIDVEIPKIGTDLGKEIHFVKLPNFISVETRPFDHSTYEDEIDDDEVLDEEGRARLKLKVENTIRWRWGVDEDANPVKESNAKFIKWSDGSMSLHLGSEIFDVHKQLLQGDHNHLFIRQGTGLQGQAVFRTKLTFRPHSTDSFTHRKITMSVADRSQKTQKIRILPNVGKDPEAHRSEMIKKEEDRLKASIRRESKQRRMKERAISRGLSASYLEGDRYDDDDEDDDGAISLAAIKNKFKKGALRENRPPINIYSSDSEGSEIDERRVRRLEKAKTISDSEAEGSEEDVGPKKKVARIEESDDD